jgi:hypothetical protein
MRLNKKPIAEEGGGAEGVFGNWPPDPTGSIPSQEKMPYLVVYPSSLLRTNKPLYYSMILPTIKIYFNFHM